MRQKGRKRELEKEREFSSLFVNPHEKIIFCFINKTNSPRFLPLSVFLITVFPVYHNLLDNNRVKLTYRCGPSRWCDGPS